MQVSVESTGALERRMEVHVPAERVEKAIDERLKSMSRTVRLKGFRPGKVPVNIIRQQFGQQVRQEVLGEVLQSTFSEAVVQENLNPVGGPRIEPVDMNQGNDLKYRATFEIYPQVDLKDLSNVEIARPVAEVTEGDIDAMLENLRKQRPNFAAVERAAQDTDRVTVDFDGTIDGTAFEGGKAEGIKIVLGAGQMLKGFEDGLLGAVPGTQKTIELTFPQDYPAKDLAGKTASFAVKVHAVEEQTLPEIDDEFCKAFGVEDGGKDKLRQEVGDNMRRELAANIRNRLKGLVLDKFLDVNQIEVPKSLVDAQVREMQADAGRRSGAREAADLPSAEQFQDAALRRVKLGILIGEVIKNHKIELDRSRVQARLEELLSQYPDPTQIIKAYRENPQAQRQIESLVLEDQAVDKLLESASKVDEPKNFRDLMNFGA